MQDIPVYKRASQGVFAMNTRDTISGLSLVYPDANYVIIVTSSGRFSKFNITGLERSVRNRAGNSVMKLSKTDRIISIYGVNDNNTLAVITTTGKELVPVSAVAVGSSVSSGIKVLQEKNPTVVKAEVVG